MSQTQEHTESTQPAESAQSTPATGEDRVARFRADVADMRLRDPKAGRERLLMFSGGILMAVGVALALIAYFQSHSSDAAYNSEGPAQQRDMIMVALTGVSITIVGAAIFLRYSLAQFLRFWLARLIYEQQAATDRIVESSSR